MAKASSAENVHKFIADALKRRKEARCPICKHKDREVIEDSLRAWAALVRSNRPTLPIRTFVDEYIIGQLGVKVYDARPVINHMEEHLGEELPR